jgi:ArsR family transcriptional regulator, arsenate/arsenite/antimonite-responsive transcriptional repressor
MEKIAETLKALSDPTRLRIVNLLRHGELCVCDLTEALQTPQSKVSRHLAFLKNAGWVRARRSGKWVHYLLLDSEPSLQASVVEALTKHVSKHPVCIEDERRYSAYLATKPSHSCD